MGLLKSGPYCMKNLTEVIFEVISRWSNSQEYLVESLVKEFLYEW